MPPKKPEDSEWPDPTKYLFVSLEQKRKDQAKPYDGKKMFWIPDEKNCYVLGNVTKTEGDMVTLELDDGEKVSFLLINFNSNCPLEERFSTHQPFGMITLHYLTWW